MLLDCLLYIYIMTKRKKTPALPNNSIHESASDIEHFEPDGTALYPVVC